MRRTPLALAAFALAAAGLAGCTTGDGDPAVYGSAGIDDGRLVGTIRSDRILQAGSSTVLPIAQAWADDFGQGRGVQVKVAGGGSGAGGKGLCKGELDIGDLSRPVSEGERQLCAAHGVDPVSWKVAFDGLSVVVSNRNDFVDGLSVAQLHHIFREQEPARTWADVQPGWPAEPVQVCAPDAESGTWDYFSEAILEKGAMRSDAQRSADDNTLVTCTAGSAYALGFFGFAYYQANLDKVRGVPVDGVASTAQTIADGSYHPLGRPIFMVTDGVPAPGSILRDYFAYAYHPEGGQRLVPLVGYVALDPGTLQEMQQQLDGTGPGTTAPA